MKHKQCAHKTIPVIVAGLILPVFFIPFAAFGESQIQSGADIPQIIPRSSWANTKQLQDLLTWLPDRNKKEGVPDYADIKRFVIHDTGCSLDSPTCNSDDVDPVYVVQNLYRFHAQSRGWGDVGYNYIIDRKGNIYEGRYGGNRVRAAHTYYDRKCINFNVGTAGITLLGNYAKSDMPQPMYDSLSKLVGWISSNNGIDPSKTSQTTPVWQNPKNSDGRCDVSSGSFDGKFTGPIVAGHGDVEEGNPDPGVVNLAKVRESASAYYKNYNNYLYQTSGETYVYVIENGYKTRFDSSNKIPAEFANRTIKLIPKAQLDAYIDKGTITYPDGSLLKTQDNPTVYYLENGKKRAMGISLLELEKMGLFESNIRQVSLSDLSAYSDGNIIKYGPDASLVKDARGNVYHIDKGKKRKFTSPQLFEYLRYKWSNVKDNAETDLYLSGSDMVYPDKTLVSDEKSGKLFLIDRSQKREIASGDLLKALGYKKEQAISATQDELNHFPAGARMIYPDNTLIKTENSPAVYVVKNQKIKQFTSAAMFTRWGYKWNNIITIRTEELADYSQDGQVSYPDGTLIKKEGEGAIFKVEDGKKRPFSSFTLFQATKSKLSDVIALSAGEFSLYPHGEPVRYPENSLIRQTGDFKIYVIKNSKAQWIKTMAEFKKARYKMGNVIEISASEMNLYTGVPAPAPAAPAPSTPPPASNPPTTPPANNPNTGNTPTSDASASNPNIRIALYSANDGDQVIVSADGNYSVSYLNSDGSSYKTENKSANEQVSIPYFNSSSYVKFTPASNTTIMQVVSYNDPSWNKAINDNKFRGNIEIKYSDASKKLWVVNELPLEDYINGIAEALNDSPQEYLKAFSVVARTYAMYYIKKGGKHAGEVFHLKNSINGNGNDQVYKGYNFEMRASKIVAANKLTTGYIVTYKSNPIVAAYSSDSGGVTKSGCDVLSKAYCTDDFAYLNGGIKDPDGTVHNADKVAASHGAGMSTVGAYKMASDGSLWQDIIKYYYPGVEVTKN